jgi:hypothetical protein
MRNKINYMRIFACCAIIILLSTLKSEAKDYESTRDKWLFYLDKVARPVFLNLADEKLKENMPLESSKNGSNSKYKNESSYLEAFARTLCGISPWLNLESGSPDEIALRNQYRQWALKSINNVVNHNSSDFMLWKGNQSLVEISIFALALYRCPWLWENMNDNTRTNVITIFKDSRSVNPPNNNWILFPAMIEAFFCYHNLPYDSKPIENGFNKFIRQWYVGDGMFSDGKSFTLDYYNSYIIQPFLTNIYEACSKNDTSFQWVVPGLWKINSRFAELQERTINADGSFPVYGRSITYRGGAFHHLADMALRHKLPPSLEPSQVRCALTAVIEKTLEAPETFSQDGWLHIGLYGNEPDLAESYITIGTLYFCTMIFLPLGLSPDDPFWKDKDTPWTSMKIWNNQTSLNK